MDRILIFFVISLKLVFINGEVWYPYQFDSGYGNREELVITKVDAVGDFQMEESVEEWRSLSVKDRAFAIGLCENQIAVLEAVLDDGKNGFKTSINYLPVNYTILDMTLLTYWNSRSHQDEVVAIATTTNNETGHPNAELIWYKLANGTLRRTATLNLQKTVTKIITFRNAGEYYLIVFNHRTQSFASADLYRFELGDELDYWLIQSIKLDVPARSAAIVEHSAKLYLTIPQESQINIYTLDENRFVHYKNVTAPKVHSVTSFKLGLQAYVAIDGYNSGIYKFPELSREDISEANWERIDFWLPIPVRTFKDEQILIAQRSLDYGTHRSFDIEVVLQNAGKFSIHDEVTCDYFGDVTHGMNCLVEEEQSGANGVKGSAPLIIGDKIGVLVPRNGTSSRLFMIYASLKQIESPVEREIKELDNYKAVLEQKMNDQVNKFKHFDENIVGGALKLDSKLSLGDLTSRIEKLQEAIAEMKSKIQNIVPQEELVSKNVFKTLIVNGLVNVHGVSNLEQINTDDFNDKFNFSDVVRSNDLQEIEGFKTFSNLDVENLSFKTVNDIPAENLAFNSSEILEIEGNIVFDGKVVVRGDVEVENFNDFDLTAEVVTINQEFADPLEFETLQSDSLQVKEANKFRLHDNYPDVPSGNQDSMENATLKNIFIPGNVTIHRVNGENLSDLIESLCLTNIKTYIPGATYISGGVNIVEALDTEFLNDFEFPTEFVFANSLEFNQITGHKTFTKDINIKELSVEKKINNVDPHKIVTLSEKQEIPGNFVFEDLKITEMLQVDGDVEQSSNFLSKPTLEDTRSIVTNANFRTLEVEGDIIIGNSFNGTNFTSYLSDVVYKSDEDVTINSLKTIHEVTVNHLSVLSNEINNIEIASIVTKDSGGFLKARTINGDVEFDYLYSNGTFNGVNITKLDKEVVRLNGTQFITANLVFENPLATEELLITGSLNDVSTEDYISTQGDRTLEELKLDGVIADAIYTNSISGSLTNFNLTDFEETRISCSKDQVVSGDWSVEKSKVETFKAQDVNGFNFEELFNVNNYAGKISDMLASGKLKIKELSVEDSLNISGVDGVDFNKVLSKCVSTQEIGRKLSLSLDGKVSFEEIACRNFNGVLFQELMANIIYKNESDVNIVGGKLYRNGFTVRNFITTPLLYNVNVQNIMRTIGDQTINSPLILEGDVFIDEGEVGGNLNGFSMEYLENTFKSDEDTYFINGDVNFHRLTRINKLHLEAANGKNVTDLLSNLINVNEDSNLNGTLIFNKDVAVKSNLAADEINGINLSAFKEEVVLITQDGSIEVPVTFKQPVVVTESLEVERDLDCRDVMGVDLRKWLEDAVFINEGMISGEIHFEEAIIASSLQTKFLNGIDLSSLINLRTDEIINATLNFKEISSFNEIRVKNVVNGYNLENEYFNTVLSERIQDVHSRVTFANNVLARRFLDVKSLVNGKDLAKMVTTDSDQRLNASYEFSNRTTFTGDIYVDGLVTGVNVTDWSINGIKKFSVKPQIIESPWNISKSLTFKNDVVGNGASINGLDLGKMVDVVESRRVFKYSVESDLLTQFRKTCRDIKSIVSISKQQIYLFDYLDYYQYIDFESDVKIMHYFKYQNADYILVSREQSCKSTLLVWSQGIFKPIQDIETGRLSQIITVNDGDLIFLVSRTDSNENSCEIDGSNIWKVAVDKLKLLYKIDAHTLLQESLKSGTFYAMSENKVEEYRIITDIESEVTKVRRWDVLTDNSAFVPRGLTTGLALRNGSSLIQMNTEDPVVVNLDDFNSVVIGGASVTENRYLPSRSSGEMVVMKAGRRGRPLALVSQPLNMSIKGKLDFIKIYEDVNKGSLFHSIPSYKPTSLLPLKFGENGEDLLLFLENQEKLQIYQYKGIEGFKHRISINAEGSQLQSLDLPYGAYPKRSTFIALINKNRINLFLAVMKGDQINDDNVECNL